MYAIFHHHQSLLQPCHILLEAKLHAFERVHYGRGSELWAEKIIGKVKVGLTDEGRTKQKCSVRRPAANLSLTVPTKYM